MELRCKHKDRLENKEIVTSFWDKLTPEERQRIAPLPWMDRREIILTFICNKCGRHKTQKIKTMEGPL